MSRHRKVDVRIWSDERFLRLSAPQPNGRDCWLYLLTNRYTTSIPGVYHAYEETLARGIGWSAEGFRKAFREVSAEGLAEADWKAGLVFIPNAAHYNKPESPNVVVSWAHHWDELPECALKDKAWHTLKAFIEGFGEGFRKAFEKACPKGSSSHLADPSPNQEQEQEQEQEKEPASRFDLAAVYQAYPGRDGKAKGLEALGKVVKSQAMYDRILAAVKRYADEERAFKASGSKEFRAGVPHFSTWVNARRWEDYDDKPKAVPDPGLFPDGMTPNESPALARIQHREAQERGFKNHAERLAAEGRA